MKFTLIIRQGQTQLIGQLKETPGVLTQGQTVEEVKENIQDALALYLEDMREEAMLTMPSSPASHVVINSRQTKVT